VFLKKEEKPSADDEEMDLVTVYQTIWRICKLPRMQPFIGFGN
jgi:MFS transporter, PAT family, solute carrier family 33 (acetyl-CoA transportor), member 1